MLNFTGALSRSMNQFKVIVQPELREILKGEFEVIEGVTVDHLAKLLDTLSGIDAWHIDHLRGIRGIALRIQTGDKNWHTFTIRNKRSSGAKTEYEKRKNAIENGYLYPYLTVQAYIKSSDELLSFAVARTVDIIEYIDKGYSKKQHTGASQIGQAEFFVIDWYDFKRRGYKIAIRE